MTKIVFQNDLNEKIFQESADIILKGGLVVFPTETVYGLGANALDENAVKNIFKAKGRPADNPLIVHIWNKEQVKQIATNIPSIFYDLADSFWPGPITMVLKKKDIIPNVVSGGLNSIGIRMPNNPIAFEFLKYCNVPIAAPSANISGRPSPTNVDHVIYDMNSKVDMIIDGGNCDIGVESTVIDLTSEIPTILRPGGITYEEIIKVLKHVNIDSHIYNTKDLSKNPKSPGMKYRHYAPNAKVIMFEGEIKEIVKNILIKEKEIVSMGYKVGILATEQTKINYEKLNSDLICMGDRNNPITISSNLFKAFREFDKMKVDYILMESIDKKGLGMAIVNRMLRASE